MTVGDAALISGALAVALAAIRVAEAAIAKRRNGKSASVPPDPCHDCRKSVEAIASGAERTHETLQDIRDGVRDLVTIGRAGRG